MDYNKIGAFIMSERKSKNLTQAKLAEKLFVSEKSVSKWENGKGLPERKTNENKQQNEKLLFNMAKELEIKDKTIWKSMWVIMIVSMIALFAGIFFTAFLIPEGIWQLISIIIICVVFLIPCFYALKLEVSVGSYKCKKCGHEIIPTYKEAVCAMHFGTTRYLKCPNCKKRAWCKKTMNK